MSGPDAESSAEDRHALNHSTSRASVLEGGLFTYLALQVLRWRLSAHSCRTQESHAAAKGLLHPTSTAMTEPTTEPVHPSDPSAEALGPTQETKVGEKTSTDVERPATSENVRDQVDQPHEEELVPERAQQVEPQHPVEDSRSKTLSDRVEVW